MAPNRGVARKRRPITTLVLALAVLFATLAFGGTSASAASAPVEVTASSTAGVMAAAAAAPNGCTAPGFLRDWNAKFRAACNAHDTCYDYVWNWAGEPGRLICDTQFLAAMNRTCRDAACFAMAVVYYNAVRAFGRPFFNNPWLN